MGKFRCDAGISSPLLGDNGCLNNVTQFDEIHVFLVDEWGPLVKQLVEFLGQRL
jgi:hypothetical protein